MALVRVSPDDAQIAICTDRFTTKVWRREPPEEVFSMDSEQSSYDALAWSPDGRRFATTLDNHTAAIVDLDSRRIERRFASQGAVRNVAFTGDGRRLVAVGAALQIWDVESGKLLHSLDEGHSVAALSPDGRLIAASGAAKISLLDLADYRVTTLPTIGTKAGYVAFSKNTLAAAVDQPPVVCLWDPRTGQELLRLDCPGTLLHSVTFSPDGKRLIATGHDENNRGRIWEWTIRGNR